MKNHLLSIKINSIFFINLLTHIVLWIIYLFLSTGTLISIFDGDTIIYHDFFLFSSSKIFIFYAIFLIMPTLFNQKKAIKGILLLIFSLFIFYSILYIRLSVAKYFYPDFVPPKFNDRLHTFVLAYVPNLITFSALGSLYWLYNNSKKQNTQKLALEKRNHEIEVSFLKSQINQHFIYNMLNMFYVNTMQYSEKLADGILSLSELMRFSVSHEQNSLIPVTEEVKFIETYINLNQLRFNDKLKVVFKTEGNLNSFKIPHLCILTLVENAFKHGDLKNESLDISIIATEDKLNVNIKNKKHSAKIEGSTGIGLNNLERRLGLLLENKFSLSTKEEAGFFYTQLIIIK